MFGWHVSAAKFVHRACKRCGKEFLPIAAGQKYCGNQKTPNTCAWLINRERQKVGVRTDYDAWLARVRSTNLKKYGLTQERYDKLLSDQRNVCKICRQPETMKTARGYIKLLSIDHDHKTGAVRGLLCAACNQAIGLLGDSPERLAAAIEYLKESTKCES